MVPKFYSDGSGWTAEIIHAGGFDAVSAASVVSGNLVVAFGLNMGETSLAWNPKESITVETDSAPHMVLYPLAHPMPGFRKNDGMVKNQYKDGALSVAARANAVGFLFFPIDMAASRFTVVAEVGSQTLRFPFARDPSFRSKLVVPERIVSGDLVQQPAATVSQLKESKPLAPAIAPVATGANFDVGQAGGCTKSIAFAMAEGGPIVSREPKFTRKWIDKNERKYPGVCFSQTPSPRSANYVIVFSTSQSAFNGIYPTTRTSTATNTSPVNGSGTITSNYGTTWNYTYTGSVTTTTTTTSQVNLPYTDTTRAIYACAYDDRGDLVSRRYRTITTRQGGGGANTLGYNLGAALGAIHLRERLLKDAVDDIAHAPH
jgi:hypothetical protein